MSENMTDKQMEVILNLVADRFESCDTMEDVKKAVEYVRELAKKKSLTSRLWGNRKGAVGLPKLPQIRYNNDTTFSGEKEVEK